MCATDATRTKSRPRLLVVGAIDRPDIVGMFRAVRDAAELHFVEYFYNYGVPTHPEHYRDYGPVHFWSEYRDAHSMLERLAPDRVVFFYVSSLTQVALRAAARDRGIPAVHLEHGFRQRYHESLDPWLMKWNNARRLDPHKLRREFPVIAANHAFFARTIPKVAPPHRRALFDFGAKVYLRGISTELLLEHADLRRPDSYVAFSPESFEYHRTQDHVTDAATRVRYVGIPQFDRFAELEPGAIDPSNLVLVDHQLHNAAIFGWTLEFRREWVRNLVSLAAGRGMRLFVKLHPGDQSHSWDEFLAPGRVEIIDQSRLLEVMRTTPTVLGNFSTMQLPLAALPHTALLTLEIHPESGHFPSRPFVDAGIAEAIRSFGELETALDAIDELRTRQQANKKSFERQFLHALDGHSGARLRDTLIDG